jgi:uncharacterized peroxidase-related enzyme
MAHVNLPPNAAPGIVGLLEWRKETGTPLSALAEVLLRGPSTLSRGDRELIAAFVSTRNDCHFCASSHAAFASAQLEDGAKIVDAVRRDYRSAPIAPKLKALLGIAEAVQKGGKNVTDALVAAARAEGATDVEIHDAVLIAAAFCMYNRYVDGLATWAPDDPAMYAGMAQMIVTEGYVRSSSSRT